MQLATVPVGDGVGVGVAVGLGVGVGVGVGFGVGVGVGVSVGLGVGVGGGVGVPFGVAVLTGPWGTTFGTEPPPPVAHDAMRAANARAAATEMPTCAEARRLAIWRPIRGKLLAALDSA
jgi:hypothetical protein